MSLRRQLAANNPGYLSDLAAALANLGVRLASIHDNVRLPDVLNEVLSLCEASAHQNLASRAKIRGALRSALWAAFQSYQDSGNPPDLNLLIRVAETALTLLRPDDPDYVATGFQFALAYELRYQATGDSRDLQIATDRLEELLQLAPNDSPERAVVADHLSSLSQINRDSDA